MNVVLKNTWKYYTAIPIAEIYDGYRSESPTRYIIQETIVPPVQPLINHIRSDRVRRTKSESADAPNER